VVAELFEKKSISQRYSFEVLCDFIHDKSKRLFGKYDAAIKEKKAAQSETSKRHLASEYSDLIELLQSYIIPQMLNLTNKRASPCDISSLDPSFLKNLFDDL
jgi:hypothetical protein